MRRVLVIASVALGAILVLFAVVMLAMRTAPGRNFAESQIESRLSAALGGDVKFGRIDGDLMRSLTIHDVTLADADGVWATIAQMRIDWRPFALAQKKISVDLLEIESAHILREPTLPEKSNEKPDRPLGLPESLPDIALRNLEIGGLKIAETLTGRLLELDAKGELRSSGRQLRVRLGASSRADTDFVEAFIDINPRTDTGELEILVASTSDGALTALSGLGGELFVEAKGGGALENFDISGAGQLGALGEFTTELSADLRNMDGGALEGEFAPGERLAEAFAEIGAPVSFAGAVTANRNSLRIDLAQLSTPNAAVAGTIGLVTRERRLRRFEGDLTFTAADGALQDITRWTGPTAEVTARGAYRRNQYDFSATLKAPLVDATVTDARTDLRSGFAGDVALTLAASDALPVFIADGGAGAGKLEWRKDDVLTISGFTGELPDGSKFTGDGRYAFADSAVAAAGDATLTPAAMSRLSERAATDGPLAIEFAVDGPIDALEAEISGTSPEIAINGGAVPAARFSLDARRQAETVNLEFSGRRRQGDGLLSFVADIDGATSLRVSRLLLAAPLFRLEGEAALAHDTGTLDLDLRYTGKDGAEPVPGVLLSGELDATGILASDGNRSDLVIAGRNIASQSVSARTIEIVTRGPSNAVGFEIAAGDLVLPGAGPVGDLTARGVATLGDAPKIRLDRLSARPRDVSFDVNEPAVISFTDGVAISNLRAAYGRYGRLAIDAHIAPSRWTATVKGANLPVRDFTTIESIDLNLDTNADQPAGGDLVIRSVIGGEEEGRVPVAITWDGDMVRLANASPDNALRFDIRTPVALERTPKVSISPGGALDGQIDFDGRLQTIAPFLPEQLATVDGDGALNVTIGGEMSAPVIAGRLSIIDGSYTEPLSGLTLIGIDANASATPVDGGADIAFTAVGRGAGQEQDTVNIDGSLRVREKSEVNATLKLAGAAFAVGPVDNVSASGEMQFTGPPDAIRGEGAFEIEELDANVISPPTGGLVDIEVRRVNGDAAESEPEPLAVAASPLILNIDVDADDRIFVRGRGLESEWRADVSIAGEATSATIVGAMNLRRGTLDFAGRRFALSRGQITFDRLVRNDPTLDIRAEIDTADGITAAIEINGRATQPVIELVSTPSRPPEDIMALILFGKPATQLSALESLQVAEALAQLGGVGPFGGGGGITGMARQSLGLDLLNVNLDSDAGASSLEVGKYVADGLFVSATQDARGENGAVRIEYEVTNSITVETELQQDGDQKVSANWKRDF